MFLDELAGALIQEVSEKKRRTSLRSLADGPLFHDKRRGFLRALRGKGRRIIAEMKRSSPSRGMMLEDFDPPSIARTYEEHGAAAVSVVTQPRFFCGDLSHLEAARHNCSLPLLMKDFLVDSFQVHEGRSRGADAILLIAAMLQDTLLQELYLSARELELDVLVEVHSEEDLERALRLQPDLIGINNRNLKDLSVDLGTTERILPLIPSGVTIISESGIRTSVDLLRLEREGVHAFLIGEWLMEGVDPGERLGAVLQW